MSIINETWDDGRSYRVKQKDGSWKKKSFLHKAKDLLFGDGNDLTNNAENNLGAIKGLTKSTNVTEEGYAVDATALAEINSKINAKFKKIYSLTEAGTFTVDVKTITDNYANLTGENFILANSYTRITGITGGNLNNSVSPPSFNMSYDSTNGILTINSIFGSAHQSNGLVLSWMIVGDIYFV